MTPVTLIVAAFLLGLAAMSFAFGGGAVVVALPLALLAIGALAVFDFSRRRRQTKQVQGFREGAKAESVEFTERDKETLVSE
jgi:MprA protease rhombosortase-interaction domain-containing protein